MSNEEHLLSEAKMPSSIRPQFELREIARARAMVRDGMARLLHASRGNTSIADDAALSLVAAVLDGTDALRTELLRGNESFCAHLEVATTWPVRLYPHLRDREAQAEELRRLKFGIACPLNLATAWQDSPGTRWAHRYWCWVNDVKASAQRGQIDQMRTERPDNQALLMTALSLPALSRDVNARTTWGNAAVAYFEAQYPEVELSLHPDWKHMAGGVAKVRERIRNGIIQIAPQSVA